MLIGHREQVAFKALRLNTTLSENTFSGITTSIKEISSEIDDVNPHWDILN